MEKERRWRYGETELCNHTKILRHDVSWRKVFRITFLVLCTGGGAGGATTAVKTKSASISFLFFPSMLLSAIDFNGSKFWHFSDIKEIEIWKSEESGECDSVFLGTGRMAVGVVDFVVNIIKPIHNNHKFFSFRRSGKATYNKSTVKGLPGPWMWQRLFEGFDKIEKLIKSLNQGLKKVETTTFVKWKTVRFKSK